MAETPEPLAAILAEMRADVADGENAFFIRADWLALCDRIEAAAERERDEDRQLAAIAESDEAFARCARCDRPERAPGNAAAMREALESAHRTLKLVCEHAGEFVQPRLAEEIIHSGSAVERALAAPARNCDRFATYEEAVNAYRAWAERTTGNVSNVSGRGMLGWLFDTAKGGAE